ncbi:MAG: hypothetical protein ABI024_06865 [Vicinamibacterales bacterium]
MKQLAIIGGSQRTVHSWIAQLDRVLQAWRGDVRPSFVVDGLPNNLGA